MTQRLPRVPPARPSDTAPLWRSEIGQLDSLMSAQPSRPAPRPPRRLPSGWWLKGLGLVGVAVVSGLVWLVVMPKGDSGTTPTTTSTAPTGEFSFARAPQAPEAVLDSSCAPHAYGKAKEYFTTTPCQQLSRSLYTVSAGGKQVLVSVVVVKMADDKAATDLKKFLDGDNTGNLYDLSREGVAKVPGGPDWVAHGEYASTVRGRELVIVESDFYGATKTAERDRKLLDRISNDALRLGS
ncbi:hypothetical protein [Saccharothrix variisporea]|uniref:Uncharacterized protein n=1 Tax=Saccharothrix variisporea TaxID=543527 RepID=A0A495XJ38_9PSEU|nr:hypothetical protein [Saccharothrix variisporea]RKT73126.1 hypothetical protein DFJ66_6453 [Saccharothrix variisporea]